MKLSILSTFIILILSCNSNNHINKIEGFKIPLPENWIDKSELSVKDNLSKFNLNDSEVSSLLKNHNGSIPVAIYTKYDPSEINGPIPTIQVNIRPNNTKDFNGFKKIMTSSITQMKNYFSNFKIISPMEEVLIDSIKGIKFITQFDLPNNQGTSWTIRSWNYAFPSENSFYQINFSDTENEDSKSVYEQIINQVKFSK
jgi:hypothetical protein